MVLGMEGDRPGLHGPPTHQSPSRPVRGTQDTRQVLSTLDGDTRSMERGLATRSCGIATDVMLFHQHGGRLVHRYHIYVDPLPHVSLCGPVMLRLTRFAIQASAMARWAITSDRTPLSEADCNLVQQDDRAPESAPPARGSGRAAATVTFAAEDWTNISTPARLLLCMGWHLRAC